MVTTRSRGSSTKHEAPKGVGEAPVKKQKTSKASKKDIEKGGPQEKPAQDDVPKVKDGQNKENKGKGKKQENRSGKPPAAEPAAAEAEKKTAGGAERDSKEATYRPL